MRTKPVMAAFTKMPHVRLNNTCRRGGRRRTDGILVIANSCMFFDQHWQSESAKLTFEMRKKRREKKEEEEEEKN